MGNNVWNESAQRWEWDPSAQGDRDASFAGGYISGNNAWNDYLNSTINPFSGGDNGPAFSGANMGGGLGPSSYSIPYDATHQYIVEPDFQNNSLKKTLTEKNKGNWLDTFMNDYLPVIGSAAVIGGGLGMFGGPGAGVEAAGTGAMDMGIGGSGILPEGYGAAADGLGGAVDSWDVMGNPESFGMIPTDYAGGLDSGSISMDTQGGLDQISGAVPSPSFPYKDIGKIAQSLLKGGASGTGGQSSGQGGQSGYGGLHQVHNTTPGMTQASGIIPQQQQIQPSQMAALSQPNFQFSGYQQISPGVQGQQVSTVSSFGQDSEIQKIAKALKDKSWQMT